MVSFHIRSVLVVCLSGVSGESPAGITLPEAPLSTSTVSIDLSGVVFSGNRMYV